MPCVLLLHLLLHLLLLLLPSALLAAGPPDLPERVTLFDAERRFESDGSRGPYQLSGRPLLAGTETVFVDGRRMVRNLDYQVDYARALLTFHEDLPRGLTVLARFQQLPAVLSPSYRLRALPDTVDLQAATVVPSPLRRRSPVNERLFSERSASPESHLDIGGSKSIRVGFGAEEALTQSLQVHVTGEVSPGVELIALLSDQNLPVSTGGSTRRIDELDRITFQIRSPTLYAGLGDMEVELDETSFGRYRRQLQGARFGYNASQADVEMFGSVSEGRWRQERIVPADGYQGPYRLTGGAGSGLSGQIVPGSERVYVDGRLLLRGEAQDYAIDYDRRAITFTPARPIRSASRISVSYQYRESAYSRRLVGMRGKVDLGDDRIHVGTTLLRESDQATGSGLSGNVSSGGPPTHQQITAADAAFTPGHGLTMRGEFAASRSGVHAVDAAGRSGNAMTFEMALEPAALRLAQADLGRVEVTGRFRLIDSGFDSFEPIDRVESEGRWGWQNDNRRDAHERTLEGAVRYDARPGVRFTGSLGRRTGESSVARREAGLSLSRRRGQQVRYGYESLVANDGDLVRHSVDGVAKLGWFRPTARIASEQATGAAVRQSSHWYSLGAAGKGLPSGVWSQEAGGGLSVGSPGGREWSSAVTLERVRLHRSVWVDSLRSWTLTNKATLAHWRALTLSGEYTHRKAAYALGAQPDRTTDLGRVKVGFAPGGGGVRTQVTYRISSTGVSRYTDTYVFVGEGKGRYVWADADGQGDEDPEEFVQEFGGDYDLLPPEYAGAGAPGLTVPAREAAVGARLEISPQRMMGKPANRFQYLLAGTAVDLSAEADRQALPGAAGVTPWDLLAFRSNEGVLGSGRSLRGDLHLFRYGRRASATLSARHRKGLSRTTGDPEGSRSVSARTRVHAGRLDADVTLTRERRFKDGNGAFAYGIRSSEVGANGSLRARGGWQFGSLLELGFDREDIRGLTTTSLTYRPELRRALPGTGRLRADFQWTHVSSNGDVPLFLGLAKGNRVGTNLAWSSSVDYRLGQRVTARVTYRGQARPDRPTVHMGQVEVQATF